MKKTLLLAFAALCFVQSALAWGKSGHDAVAYIAETHLTKRAKAVIERYLGHSIVYGASWMDDYRAEQVRYDNLSRELDGYNTAVKTAAAKERWRKQNRDRRKKLHY